MGVLGILGVAAGSLLRPHATTEGLPQRSAAQLASEVQTAASRSTTGYSGTIIAHLSLDLPLSADALDVAVGGADGPAGDASGGASTIDGVTTAAGAAAVAGELEGRDPGGRAMTDVLSGSHTLRYWYGGPDRERVALLGPNEETDVFYSGRDVWLWDSTAHVATHSVTGTSADAPLSVAALTPQHLAESVLAAVDPATRVTLGGTRRVADRGAYDLVVTPGDPDTRVGSVHISVDGATKVPLGVRVYPRGADEPAVDVSFVSVQFRQPTPSLFAFSPPSNATVRYGTRPGLLGAVAEGAVETATMGSGWSSVVEVSADRSALRAARAMLQDLPRVHGDWGSGRVVECPLLSMLVTDGGRVFVGAVGPEALYRAAGG